MIPANATPWEPDVWRAEMKSACRSSGQLLRELQIDAAIADDTPDFPTLIPRGYIARMQPGKADDPLLLQVLARTEERQSVPGYELDALAETTQPQAHLPPGLLQKYHGRALLITTGACAVHCRYCFRRHFPYTEHRRDQLSAALQHIGDDPSISEVILSGGDPLMLSDRAIADLLNRLSEVPHLRRVRIHSRLPVVLPQRITTRLLQHLASARPQIVLVTHFNHAQELDTDCARGLACLAAVCAQLLNQTVLLRGVNDDAQTQIELAIALFEYGVLPYYLHLPDRVAGTAHFDVAEQRAIAIHRAMQAALPGYLLPRLVREIPGAASKTIVRG